MLLCINYATDNKTGRDFRPWQQLQTQTAYLSGADKVIEYSPKDIPAEFYEKNKFILDQPRGAGYWLWKPYIIKDALSKVNDGDYVFYADSGSFYIDDITPLMKEMENLNVDVTPFKQGFIEKTYTKRDAFILMDCDSKEYTDTPQRLSGFIFLKKTPNSVALIDEFLEYMQDPRIVTDMPNQMGKENYEGFKDNRHDQTVWSLLTKKKGIPDFLRPDLRSYICLHRRVMNREGIIPLFLKIISMMKRIEKDKELIPKEFQYGLTKVVKVNLAGLLGRYINKSVDSTLPADLPPPEEILDSCRELDLPEIPFFKEALAKLQTPLKQTPDKTPQPMPQTPLKQASDETPQPMPQTPLKQASDETPQPMNKDVATPQPSMRDRYILASLKNPSLEDALLKLSARQDLMTSLDF